MREDSSSQQLSVSMDVIETLLSTTSQGAMTRYNEAIMSVVAQRNDPRIWRACTLACAVILLTARAPLAAPRAPAQPLTGDALVAALRHGGYVLVMRHASSPVEPPANRAANRDNLKRERQLDAPGRTSAAAMGEALRELRIPIGEVLSSPTYRALETVRVAELGTPKTFPELGDGGRGMRQVVPDAQAAWLRRRVAITPKGANTIIVTHLPNIARAFPEAASGLADGEALVFSPDGSGGAALVARIPIDEWPRISRPSR